MKHYDSIGKTIKYYRIKKGITQQNLADKLGVTWEMISRYETGKSSPIHRIFDIADALNITPAELLQDSYISSPYIKISIPYWTQVPKNFKFEINNTKDQYVAPLWITNSYPDAFCIKSSLIQIKPLLIKNSSILYVDPNIPPKKKENIVLYISNNTLIANYRSLIKQDYRIIGKIIASEERFV